MLCKASYAFAVENRNITLKAYFTPNTELTDIENYEIRDLKSTMIYDLMGRRVEHPAKGIYIKGRKKMVVK